MCAGEKQQRRGKKKKNGKKVTIDFFGMSPTQIYKIPAADAVCFAGTLVLGISTLRGDGDRADNASHETDRRRTFFVSVSLSNQTENIITFGSVMIILVLLLLLLEFDCAVSHVHEQRISEISLVPRGRMRFSGQRQRIETIRNTDVVFVERFWRF